MVISRTWIHRVGSVGRSVGRILLSRFGSLSSDTDRIGIVRGETGICRESGYCEPGSDRKGTLGWTDQS
jgi:hypothetical protein